MRENSGEESDMTVIGLSGYAQSGKDSVASILSEHGYRRRSFADPIRSALYTLDPMIDNFLSLREIVDKSGWDAAKSYPEARRLLQQLGTEVGRDMLGQSTWIDIALRNLPERTCFTDVRFVDEADAIRALGGEVWRVNRSGVDPVNDHISETALDGYDFDRIIPNDSTLEDLRLKTLAAVAWRFTERERF
jgi:hypothetical protein